MGTKKGNPHLENKPNINRFTPLAKNGCWTSHQNNSTPGSSKSPQTPQAHTQIMILNTKQLDTTRGSIVVPVWDSLTKDPENRAQKETIMKSTYETETPFCAQRCVRPRAGARLHYAQRVYPARGRTQHPGRWPAAEA